MTNTLKVIKPFFVVEPGDTFEKDSDGMYVSSYNEECSFCDDECNDMSSCYTSSFKLSEGYAKSLIEEGFLEEKAEKKSNEPFVNVFDEIDKLYNIYVDDLKETGKNASEIPACMRVEKETVLANLIKVLDHLRSLKK